MVTLCKKPRAARGQIRATRSQVVARQMVWACMACFACSFLVEHLLPIASADTESFNGGRQRSSNLVNITTPTPGIPTGNPKPKNSAPDWRIFVTKTQIQGDFGGNQTADSICQAEAEAAKRSGTWIAILSNNATAPAAQQIHARELIRALNGKTEITTGIRDFGSVPRTIAMGAADLFSSPLRMRIAFHADSSTAADAMYVWTGSRSDGSADSRLASCGNWKEGQSVGQVGMNIYADSRWLQLFEKETPITYYPCEKKAAFYCIGNLNGSSPSPTPTPTSSYTPDGSTLTPTETATATPTSTPLEGSRNTRTPTQTPTPTVGSESGGLITQTPTPTPSYTNTAPAGNAELEVGTPTPTATPITNLVGVRSLADGRIAGEVGIGRSPLVGAIVYAPGIVDLSLTDQNGSFSFIGAPPGIATTLKVRATQLINAGFDIPATSGNFYELQAHAIRNYNPFSCSEKDRLRNLYVAGVRVRDAYRLVIADLRILRLKSTKPSQQATERGLARARYHARRYLDLSALIPDRELQCNSTVSSCLRLDLRTILRNMKMSIRHLRMEGLLCNRTLRVEGLRSTKNSNKRIREIRKKHLRAMSLIKQLAKRRFVCT